MIKKLQINSWRQFDSIDIDFHERLTILTGANGAGKTTLLNIINQHFNWPNQFVGTAKQDKKTGALKYFSDLWKKLTSINPENSPQSFGNITYGNGANCKLLVPESVGSVYNINYENLQQLNGFNIPSHRPIYKYQKVDKLATNPITKRRAFDNYRNSQRERYFSSGSRQSETYFIKEALISLATFGYGNKVVTPNEASISIYEGFINVLKTVLPPKLGFQNLSIRIPEVVLETDSGDFNIDAVSGGIASIIDLAWQIFMYNDSNEPFVVSFDEPENHLHPEMQKTLLPNFLKAFPNVQFVVASHNPFIISSVSDSNVYALVYDESNRVFSQALDSVDKTATANEILRDVLGIDSTTPDWVDERIDELILKYQDSGLNKENILQFKAELKSIGLEKYTQESTIKFIQSKK